MSASILENASSRGFNLREIFYFPESTQGHSLEGLGWERLDMGNGIWFSVGNVHNGRFTVTTYG